MMKKLNHSLHIGLSTFFLGMIAIANLSELPVCMAQPDRQVKQNRDMVLEVWEIINREYFGKKFNAEDWKLVRTKIKDRTYNTSQESYKAIRSMLETLDDKEVKFYENLADLYSSKQTPIESKIIDLL